MTIEDVSKLLWMIAGSYDNFKLDNIEAKTNAWYFDLHDFSAEDVYIGYKIFKRTKGSAFAPTPDEIIACMRVPQELAVDSKAGVWDEIRKAIGNSAYNSVKEFEKLSEVAKEIVRSASQLQEWATREDFNESVIQSLVFRSYDEAVKNKNLRGSLPAEAQMRLAQLQQETTARLTVNDSEKYQEKVVTPSDCAYSQRLNELLIAKIRG